MDSANEELYLMKLKSYVYDEESIVTAAWLSKKLDIDINASHQILQQFVKDQATAGEKIGVTYTLSGLLRNTKQHIIMLAHDKDLALKKKLCENITEELIYSVQKTMDINMNCIGSVDMLNWQSQSSPLLGCAVSKNCIPRTNRPAKTVWPEQARVPSTDRSKASHLFSKASVSSASSSSSIQPASSSSSVKTTSSTSIKTEADSQEEKESPAVKKEKTKKITKQNSNEKAKSGNNLMAMFANASAPREKVEKVEKMEVDDSSEAEINVETKKNDLYDSGTDDEAKKVEDENRKKKRAESPQKKPRSKRQRADKSTERAQKKRKRIAVQVESDDDIFGGDDNDDVEQMDVAEGKNISLNIIDSDEEETAKSGKSLAPLNRKRKWVDKTYEDEEGYVVTKQEWVYDSNEEPDVEEDANKENPQNGEVPVKKEKEVPAMKEKVTAKAKGKDPSPPTKGKGKKQPPAKPANQPTLMSFFKRK